jgi:dTMP kinase
VSDVGATDAGGFRGAIAHRDFRRLLIGQAISGLGDWVGTFAFIAAAYELTANATAVGAVLVLRLLPPLLAAPIGGVIADRVDRRRLMIACDLARAAIIVFVPFVGIALLYVLAFVHESVSMVFLPARDASIPDLVDENELPEANGLMLASSFGSLPVGAALFSGLQSAASFAGALPLVGNEFRTHPTSFAFAFDAATFLVSAWAISRMSTIRRERSADMHLVRGFLQGAWFVLSHPGLRAMAAALLVCMLGGGALFAVGIAYVLHTLDASTTVFGWLAALWGVGMALGVAGTRWRSRVDRGLLFVGSVSVCAAVLIAMALFPITWLALVLSIPFGAAFSLAVVLGLSLVQHVATDDLRARVLGGIQGLFRVSLAVGALGLGAMSQSLGGVSLGVVTLDGNQLAILTAGVLVAIGADISRRSRVAPWKEV